MYTYDVVQIVDVYRSYYEGPRQGKKVDHDAEAQGLSMLVKALGRNDRKIALIAQDDDSRREAYQRAGYETHTMNGSRTEELRQFTIRMTREIRQAPPKHMVLVTDDPDFAHLCDAVSPATHLAIWTSSAQPPRELTDPSYDWRPLNEMMPSTKIPRIDVRIDLENIFIGLVKRGWKPNLRELNEAIRQSLDGLGEVISLTGYADFDELNRHHGGPGLNWQRELMLAGCESRYVINQHGKNTADMKIADDIRTLVEHDPNAGGAIDIIGLATMDRDFRHIVDTARSRGKKVIVLGLRDGLSRELQGAASQVRYLDGFLQMPTTRQQEAEPGAPPQREDLALMMEIADWMNGNRWRFVFRDRLEQEFSNSAERLRQLIADGWLVASSNSTVDAKGQPRMLEPNPNHTAARAAHYLARWLPGRLDHCLNQRNMPHVDSKYLAEGMTRDRTLVQMGVGQTRSDAERWLWAAADARLIIATQHPHPKNAAKLITTWRLLESEDAGGAVEETDNNITVTPHQSGHLRQLLTQGLSDGELTQLLFDHFRPVHREVDGAPKFARIQALLGYVEARKQQTELLTAITQINPALGEEPHEQLLAA